MRQNPYAYKNGKIIEKEFLGVLRQHFIISPEGHVTGYWKTDHNVTLGQLHFIGLANSHTHALSMHCCITGLS